MKTAIVYVSTHHGNTKKLVDAIAAVGSNDKENSVVLIDGTEQKAVDLSGYDNIGFASGVAYGKYYPQILKFMENNLPEGKKVFFIHTAGDPRENHNAAAKRISDEKHCEYLGTYFCKGYDTYGPFKLIGGINKGRPNEQDISKAVEFYKKLV